MSCVHLDIGSIVIYFNDIAEQVVSDCEEEAFLRELARQSESIATQSNSEVEKTFAAEAATRLRDLAEWFRVNQP